MMIQKNRKQSLNTKQRRGILTLEFLLTVPILMMILFAMFEFSLLFYARASVVEASRAGARLACVPGVQIKDIELEVHRVLPQRLSRNCRVQTVTGDYSGDLVAVHVAVPMQAVSPNLLWPIGFDLNGQNIVSETRMLKE